MLVKVGIRLGENPPEHATKELELDFAPTTDMRYHDTTWKDTAGRRIIRVTIANTPDDGLHLDVELEGDSSDQPGALADLYEQHGWKIRGR